jgi:23S rRNA pseudouridine1911/1915/1917 synthase
VETVEAPASADAVLMFRADRGDAGRRLDHVLGRHLADRPDASRTRIQRWIRSGEVTVDGLAVTRVAARVPADAELTVRLPRLPPKRRPEGEAIPLDILFEDDCLLAVNKPAGLIVHPSFGHATGKLMNALLWHARDWPQGRPSLANRLDKHTSGVLLVAKSPEVHAALVRASAARRLDKQYLAVVVGRVPRAGGEISLGLSRDPHDRRRVIASPHAGRPSLTRYVRLARTTGARAGLSLLRCTLVTGRTHQIRVHLAASGWPIVGDPVYGPTRTPRFEDLGLTALVRGFTRQALHAWRLAFPHPVTGVATDIVAPVPRDMAELIAAALGSVQAHRLVHP